MKARIRIIHGVSVIPEVEITPSIYCPNDKAYIMPDNTNPFQWAKSVYQAEKETNDWIRKYHNAIDGLNYWKEKAMYRD